MTIVSSDKDLMQLVGNGVDMLDPMKNIHIGPDQVFEKFGVDPGRVVDVQALAGIRPTMCRAFPASASRRRRN